MAVIFTNGMPNSHFFGFPSLIYPHYTTPNNVGWECPKCGRVYSPSATQCGHCNQDTDLKAKEWKVQPNNRTHSDWPADIAMGPMGTREGKALY